MLSIHIIGEVSAGVTNDRTSYRGIAVELNLLIGIYSDFSFPNSVYRFSDRMTPTIRGLWSCDNTLLPLRSLATVLCTCLFLALFILRRLSHRTGRPFPPGPKGKLHRL